MTNFVDRWTDAAQPFICNEKDVIIKLELDEEALKNHMAEYQASIPKPLAEHLQHLQDSSSGHHSHHHHRKLYGFVSPKTPNFDQVLIGYAPHPTNKPHQVLPRYLMNVQ